MGQHAKPLGFTRHCAAMASAATTFSPVFCGLPLALMALYTRFVNLRGRPAHRPDPLKARCARLARSCVGNVSLKLWCTSASVVLVYTNRLFCRHLHSIQQVCRNTLLCTRPRVAKVKLWKSPNDWCVSASNSQHKCYRHLAACQLVVTNVVSLSYVPQHPCVEVKETSVICRLCYLIGLCIGNCMSQS